MKAENSYYIVERVPKQPDLWYCHQKGYGYIPVFGSIGSKQKAASVCRTRNIDGKVRYG